jgi:hypothetical protein
MDSLAPYVATGLRGCDRRDIFGLFDRRFEIRGEPSDRVGRPVSAARPSRLADRFAQCQMGVVNRD